MSVSELSGHDLKSAADFQQLVDDIESLMASPGGVAPEAVAPLHAAFEQAVKIVNGRLRECDALLKKGLRGEALAHCDSDPKLLDLFLIVDFPERESWMETVRKCGLAPTELLSGIATELSDAAAAEKPLADLKYQMRLHALGRSPLPVRIGLMRRLARLDQSTTLWEEDLKGFEQARHSQLSTDVQAALRSGQLNSLTALDEELRSPDWITPPPKTLVKQVAEALAQVRRQRARQELRRIEASLIEAFAAFDVVRGREQRQEWQKWAQDAALPSSDPLVVSVTPALTWLQEQDQNEQQQAAYMTAVTNLTQALDDGADRIDLEGREHALLALGQGIPEDLEARLRQRYDEMDRETRFRRRMQVGFGVAAAALIAVGMVLVVRAAGHRREVAAQAAILRQRIDERQLREAQDHLALLEQNSPAIAEEPEIQKLKSELQTALEDDAVRRKEYDGLLAGARRDGIDQATLKSVPAALTALSKAWDVARGSAEKSDVKALTGQVQARKKSLQDETDSKFTEEVRRQDEKYASIKDAPFDYLDDLQTMKSDLAALLERDEVTPALRKGRAEELAGDVDKSIQQVRIMQSDSRSLVEINASIGNRPRFISQLQAYVASPEFANSTRHRDFQRVLAEDVPLWQGYLDWSAHLDALMLRDLITLDGIRANKLKMDSEKLLALQPPYPFFPKVKEIVAFLAKTAPRERGSQAMELLLMRKLFKLRALRTAENVYYFVGEPPKPDATDNLSVKYFIDTAFDPTKSIRVKRTSVRNPPNEWDAPQVAFAEEAGRLLTKMRDERGATWDKTFIEILGSLYKNAGMDPILKVQLIPHIITSAGEGSDFLPKRLEKVKMDIERENLNPATNWVHPEDAEANEVRTRAQGMLTRMAGDLRDVKPLIDEAEAALQALRNPRFNFRYGWAGWVFKSAGKWTGTLRSDFPTGKEGADLFVLVSRPGEANFVRVGTVRQGRPIIDTTATEVIEGRPLFEKLADPPLAAAAAATAAKAN